MSRFNYYIILYIKKIHILWNLRYGDRVGMMIALLRRRLSWSLKSLCEEQKEKLSSVWMLLHMVGILSLVLFVQSYLIWIAIIFMFKVIIVPKKHSVMAKDSRSRVRVRTYTSCKSLGQPRFYSLIWAHKVCFSGDKVSPIKKKVIITYGKSNQINLQHLHKHCYYQRNEFNLS
jgi:hypothetical protein